jgi:two-component system response regulator AtoC
MPLNNLQNEPGIILRASTSPPTSDNQKHSNNLARPSKTTNITFIGPSHKKLKFKSPYAEHNLCKQMVQKPKVLCSVRLVRMPLEKILVVGKETNTQQLARSFTLQLFAADHTNDIWDLIDSVDPDLILFDTSIPHELTCTCLETINSKSINIPVVVITDENNNEHAERIMNLGANDCIKGQPDLKRLGCIIDKILNTSSADTQQDNIFFSEDCPSSVSIVGKSLAIAKALKMIRLVAKSACNPVLIVGETGTGKELAARAVHIIRHGSNNKFVAINCAALTANLLESELFGHVKGSFTSADREKTGLLELAGAGSIFLDEISEMPAELQSKLLRVLQEKTFRKVGGLTDIPCNATIITSSNRNLFKEVQMKKFRSDLYYRLSICPIILAPLRHQSRQEDIPVLAEYFIRNSEICPDKTGKIKGLTKLAVEKIQNHPWPGNVRELKNVIERAIMLETSDKIGLSNLVINPDQYFDEPTNLSSPGLKDFSLEKAEKELVAKALAEAGWQKTRAAAMLGITRATLYAKVKQYDIKQPQEKIPVTVA